MSITLIPQPEPYIRAFEQLGFGMFIHWGLYSQLGQGEWVMYMQNIPKSEYRQFMKTFTAWEFNAREIAALAKRAGMNYIVLTTRHHDGFSLYDTRGLNDFDAPHSAAGRDLVAEFVEGCRAEGIIPFFYHTTLDWSQESYHTNFNAYLSYLRKSIEILCTQYGKIGGFWFDGHWDRPNDDWQDDLLYSLIRQHQPEAIIVNNSGLQDQGGYGHPEIDSVTFEQGRPHALDRTGRSKYVAGEMCQTINSHWGFGSQDFNSQSVKDLIHNLAACRKVGANYLLNVGPSGSGKIEKLQEALLEEIGKWTQIHKQAVYDVNPSAIRGYGADFALMGGNGKLYLFIHHLGIKGNDHVTSGGEGAGPRTFKGIKQQIKSLRWLDNQESLIFVQNVENDLFSFNATGYPYGTNLVIRVAEAEMAE